MTKTIEEAAKEAVRKERRKIERNFNALAQRFVLHCKIYNITIRPSKDNGNDRQRT